MLAKLLQQFRRPVLSLAVCGALTAISPVRAVRQNCPGDCNSNLQVSFDEIIIGVKIALGLADVPACSPANRNGDFSVRVGELIAAVESPRVSCPVIPTPTPTGTATNTPTLTLTPTPTPTLGFD